MVCNAALLFLSILCVPSVSQVIIQPPESVTQFLNQDAVFTCVTDGGTPGWIFNGTVLGDHPSDTRQYLKHTQSITTSGSIINHLTISSRDVYNETTVQCVILTFGTPVLSDNVMLYIQGPPSSVDDVRATHSSSSVTVRWTAPFSLNVTGVDQDMWYSVIIYNVTDENNPTVINCTDCINITDTYYTFTPDSPGLCQSFNFSIIPMNGAGQGERSYTEYSITLSAIRPSLEALSSKECRVIFRKAGKRCWYRINVDDYTFHWQSSSQLQDIYTFDLRSNKEYSFNISSYNDAGILSNTVINFTTFDVQSIEVNTSSDYGIIVRGEFMMDTRARGALLILQQTEDRRSPDVFRVLLRPELTSTLTATIAIIPSSTYTALVYDLEEDGVPGKWPAYRFMDSISVKGEVSRPTSAALLKGASIISLNSSMIIVDCEFKEDVEDVSCVIVYREYGNNTLVAEEYHQNTVFPVTLTIHHSMDYTIAVFGKSDSSFDHEPIAVLNIQTSATTTTAPLPTIAITDISQEKTEIHVIATSLGTVIGVLLMVSCVAIVILLVVVVKQHDRGKSIEGNGSGGVTFTRGLEYEEVLPVINATSVIDTQPNTAYISTMPGSTVHVNTQPNAAYAITNH